MIEKRQAWVKTREAVTGWVRQPISSLWIRQAEKLESYKPDLTEEKGAGVYAHRGTGNEEQVSRRRRKICWTGGE